MVVDIYASNLFLYLARFIQPDTLTAGGPQGMNRYAYASNNPLYYTDPSGHVGCSDIPIDSPARAQCENADLIKKIEIDDGFTNVAIVAGQWTTDQLQILEDKLVILRNAFGGS